MNSECWGLKARPQGYRFHRGQCIITASGDTIHDRMALLGNVETLAFKIACYYVKPHMVANLKRYGIR